MTTVPQTMRLPCSRLAPNLDPSLICHSVLHKRLFYKTCLQGAYKFVMSKSIILAEQLSKCKSQNECRSCNVEKESRKAWVLARGDLSFTVLFWTQILNSDLKYIKTVGYFLPLLEYV